MKRQTKYVVAQFVNGNTYINGAFVYTDRAKAAEIARIIEYEYGMAAWVAEW